MCGPGIEIETCNEDGIPEGHDVLLRGCRHGSKSIAGSKRCAEKFHWIGQVP